MTDKKPQWEKDLYELMILANGNPAQVAELVKRELSSQRAAIIAEVIERVEGMKRKHWVFECNGAHGGKGCYETFCGDDSTLGPCTSDDAKAVRAHNDTLDQVKRSLQSLSQQ